MQGENQRLRNKYTEVAKTMDILKNDSSDRVGEYCRKITILNLDIEEKIIEVEDLKKSNEGITKKAK